jgi:hypothetical protein
MLPSLNDAILRRLVNDRSAQLEFPFLAAVKPVRTCCNGRIVTQPDLPAIKQALRQLPKEVQRRFMRRTGMPKARLIIKDAGRTVVTEIG